MKFSDPKATGVRPELGDAAGNLPKSPQYTQAGELSRW